MVVSVREKVSIKTSGKNQGDEEIEPLMKCRKSLDEIKTEALSLPREEFGRAPDNWPSGLRHIGGMNLI